MASSFSNANSEEQASGPDLDILILGKSGHGKSATANSILGEHVFKTSSDTMSETTETKLFQKEIAGRKLLLVDTSSLCDTRCSSTKESQDKALHEFSFALSLCPEGFHAILLVFEYGGLMTKQELDAIKELQSVLGENVVRNHAVLIMTYGDDFEWDMKGEKDFKTWCKEQDGYLRDVLRECQQRVVLFNNRRVEAWKQQRLKLIQVIDSMASGSRYTGPIYEKIKEEWNKYGKQEMRNAYLDVCRLSLGMNDLVKITQVNQQTFAEEMRHKVIEVRMATEGLTGSVKKKIDMNIKRAEVSLDHLEKENLLCDIIPVVQAILLKGLHENLDGVVMEIKAVFSERFEHVTKSGECEAERCAIQ